MEEVDVVVIGAGVNGLAAALVLAHGGLVVRVFDDKPAVAAGTRATQRLGLVPRDLFRLLGVDLPLAPRDPSRFVPTTTPGKFLLAGAGAEGFRAAAAAIAPNDVRALAAMHAELDAFAADLDTAWLGEPLGIEETAERYVDAARRKEFIALCRGSIGAYVDRFGIESDLLKAAIAVDALATTWGSWDAPGTGAPLLVRHAAGDLVPVGGMNALIRALVTAAQSAGVAIDPGKGVVQILVEGNAAAGVLLSTGEEVRASTVVSSADPFRLRAMIGDARLPSEYTKRVDGFARSGSVTTISFALSAAPRFTCVADDRALEGAIIHLLPGDDALASIRAAFTEAEAGRLPSAPPVECVIDKTDRRASLLVPWSPYALAGTTWAAEEERFVARILSIVDTFAPGASKLVTDASVLTPKKLESHFGVTRGHVNHVDDAIVFADRQAYATPILGLYACGAGAAPAGGVVGAAGHNAAKRVLADLELGLERTAVEIH